MDKLFPYANVLFETYNIKKNDDMEKEENTVAITATPNGPFIVEGNFKLIDREGKARYEKEESPCVAADALINNPSAMVHTGKSTIMIYL